MRPDSTRPARPGPGNFSFSGLERHDEAGFTLIELLISIIIMPLIVGAIAVALVSVFSLQNSTSARLTTSGDAQVVSQNFESDIHGAVQITTDGVVACGASTQTQLLAVEWQQNASSPGGYQSVVSYVLTPTGGTTYAIVRQFCASGTSTSPTNSATVSFGVTLSQAKPTVYPTSLGASSAWVSAAKVTSVSWILSETSFQYTVIADPTASTSSATTASVVSPTNNCGFATLGTGTYSSSLCFVDFSNYLTPTAVDNSLKNGTCISVSEGIPGTADTLSFCLVVTSTTTSTSSFPYTPSPIGNLTACPAPPFGPICPAVIPTYYSPNVNGSEAYLGNNGFYTGVAGRPALYQVVLGSSVTLTFNSIQVTGPSGATISGWKLVTGDAESTDSGESTTWTTSSAATWTSTTGASFTLLPDAGDGSSQVAAIGNACGDSSNVSGSYSGWPDTDLVFSGGANSTTGPTVLCGANVSSDKTGTVLLQVLTPASMRVVLNGNTGSGYGNGQEAVFIGVLLP